MFNSLIAEAAQRLQHPQTGHTCLWLAPWATANTSLSHPHSSIRFGKRMSASTHIKKNVLLNSNNRYTRQRECKGSYSEGKVCDQGTAPESACSEEPNRRQDQKPQEAVASELVSWACTTDQGLSQSLAYSVLEF